MRLVIIDDTVEQCRSGEEAGVTSGDVMGRILEMEEHIHVASLAVSASTQNGSYQRIGQWKVCKSVDSAAPANGKGVEIFLGAEDNTLLAFYKGCQVDVTDVVVDTGSATTLLSADSLAAIGIVPDPHDVLYTIRGVGGIEAVFSRKVDRLLLGTRAVPDFEIEVGGMDYGFSINGILGMDFLLHTGAVIDLRALQITFL